MAVKSGRNRAGSRVEEAALPNSRSINVLVACDRSGARTVIRQALGMLPIGELTECHDASEVLPRLRSLAASRGRIDAVLLGRFTSGGELDVVREIRAAGDVDGPRLPILVIGVPDTPDFEEDVLAAGASVFIPEPIRSSDLQIALLGADLAGAEPNRELDVMIVEDTESNRTIIRHFLKALPARRVLEATDGVAALRMLRALSERNAFPHVLIVDYMMQPMDGLALVRQIRSSCDLADPDVPILMLTFKGDRETVAASQAAGADGFVVKPVAGPALINRLKRVLAKPRVRREEAAKPQTSSLMERFKKTRQGDGIDIVDDDQS